MGRSMASTDSDNNRQDTLYDLMDDYVNRKDVSVSQLINELVRAVRIRLNMDVAFVSEFLSGRRIFRYVDSEEGVEIIAVGGSDPLSDSYCQRVVDGLLPEMMKNAQLDPEAQKIPATFSIPVGAHVSVPIRLANGDVYGTFCTFSRQAKESLDDRDLAFVQVFSDIAGGLISKSMGELESARAMRARIHDLIENDRLMMFGQPIINLSDDSIQGYELLLRMRGPNPVRPDIIFKDATQVGLGNLLGQWTVERSIEILSTLPEDVFVSINLTPEFILDNNLADLFDQVDLTRLVIEITEHEVIKDYSLINAQLAPLREKGARLSVDDAGAGYASLRHILLMVPDIIKLDISLIRNIDCDLERQALTTALIAFANCCHYQLIAEGIETQAERDTLIRLGARFGQGYLISKPHSMV